MPVCQRQKDTEHNVGISGKGDEMVAAWSPLAREPVFHSPFACAGPAHGRLDRPMGGSQTLMDSHLE